MSDSTFPAALERFTGAGLVVVSIFDTSINAVMEELRWLCHKWERIWEEWTFYSCGTALQDCMALAWRCIAMIACFRCHR